MKQNWRKNIIKDEGKKKKKKKKKFNSLSMDLFQVD